MNVEWMFSAVILLLGSALMFGAIVAICKRTGHRFFTGVVSGLTAFLPAFVSLLLGVGFLSSFEFLIVFAASGLLTQFILFILALKPRSNLNTLPAEAFS